MYINSKKYSEIMYFMAGIVSNFLNIVGTPNLIRTKIQRKREKGRQRDRKGQIDRQRWV